MSVDVVNGNILLFSCLVVASNGNILSCIIHTCTSSIIRELSTIMVGGVLKFSAMVKMVAAPIEHIANVHGPLWYM